MLKSLCIAFATYSRLPVPRVDWNEKNLRLAICFFPLIGAVIGALEYLWFRLSGLLGCADVLRGAVAAALPLLVTGGIHADGFCDTVDALSSHAEREKKLEILKDSHCGAFAVIFFGLWLLLFFAGWTSIASVESILCAALAFVVSRALSGLALNHWPQARRQGMLRTVADAGNRRAITVSMIVYLLLACAGLLLTDTRRAAAVIAVNALVFLWYRLTSIRQFGGVTGDLAGCFVTVAELASVGVLALTEGVFL